MDPPLTIVIPMGIIFLLCFSAALFIAGKFYFDYRVERARRKKELRSRVISLSPKGRSPAQSKPSSRLRTSGQRRREFERRRRGG